MEEKPAYIVDLSAETSAAVGKLVTELGPERVILLADLICQIESDTGWGSITILIAEKRVVRIKGEKSY